VFKFLLQDDVLQFLFFSQFLIPPFKGISFLYIVTPITSEPSTYTAKALIWMLVPLELY